MKKKQPAALKCCGKRCAVNGRVRISVAEIVFNGIAAGGFRIDRTFYQCDICGKKIEVDGPKRG